jgi:hypothetical protein
VGGTKMPLSRGAAKSLIALALSVGVLVLMIGVTASASKPSKSSSQTCEPPDHWHGMWGWHHGSEISLVPPPNWDCNHPKSGTKVHCDAEPPDYWHGMWGWHHGSEISLVPPPNWCAKGTTPSPSASPSPGSL